MKQHNHVLGINQPALLHKPISSTGCYRPILMAAHDLDDWMIGFRRKASVLNTADSSVVISGLTLLDSRAYAEMGGRNFVVSFRPITIRDVIFISRTTRFLIAAEEAESVSLENCYVWRRSENVPVPYTLCNLHCRNVDIRQCLFAGSSSIHFGDSRVEAVAERSSFIGTIGAWQVSEQSMTLRTARNLYVGVDWVMGFYHLDAASAQDRLAAARARIPRYRGEFNGFFACKRLAPSLSDQPGTDLAAWQLVTNNGEVNPQFVDPGFVNPDLLGLATARCLPPDAFELRKNSRIKRLNIGCDVSSLPTFPERLSELLGGELRFDGQ